MINKPKRGRPPLPPENVRKSVLKVKLTTAERAVVDAAGGSQPSVWARDLLLRAARRRAKKE